jgi:hypothetical protein
VKIWNVTTIFLIIAAFSVVSASDHSDLKLKTTVTRSLSTMPLTFTENQGQWPDSVLFQTNVGSSTICFTKNGAYYQFTRRAPSLSREGGKPVGVGQEVYPPDTRQDHKGPDLLSSEPDSIETMTIKANFVGSNPQATVRGEGLIEYKCNYFLGNDPTKWRTDVPNYSAIVYEDIYPGIDLKYYGQDGKMKYDYTAPLLWISYNKDVSCGKVHKGV